MAYLIQLSVHPTTLFPGLMLWYLSGWSEDYSDILVLYVGAGHFWGVQNFKFQYFLWFSRKENESFLGGGGMKKLLIYFGTITNWAILGVISIHFRAFFKAKVHNGNVFGGSQNFNVFFFFFGGGGRGYA